MNRLSLVAQELKVAAVWSGSGLAVDASKDDYIYELYCYFRLAVDAALSFDLRVAGKLGTAKGRTPAALWPKKPGLKKNYSYLSLADRSGGVERYQLCPGVKILDIHGKERAPDFSLLAGGAPADILHTHVQAFWDAKFTKSADRRLPDTAVSDFIFTFQQLGNPAPQAIWAQRVTYAAWQRSGLLTNGRESTERDRTLIAYKVSETSGFPDGPPVTRP